VASGQRLKCSPFCDKKGVHFSSEFWSSELEGRVVRCAPGQRPRSPFRQRGVHFSSGSEFWSWSGAAVARLASAFLLDRKIDNTTDRNSPPRRESRRPCRA
jgi:hypothetical protein